MTPAISGNGWTKTRDLARRLPDVVVNEEMMVPEDEEFQEGWDAKTLERMAEVSHDIWADWMRYLFEVSRLRADGSCLIPADKVSRWKRQMDTQYTDLSEQEQDTDREVARKILDWLVFID